MKMAEMLGKTLSVQRAKSMLTKDYFYTIHVQTNKTKIKAGDEDQYLVDAYDLHNHAGPDYIARPVDMIEEALQASQYGMAGLAFKDHFHVTSNCAYLVERYLDKAIKIGEINKKVNIYGGIGLSLGLDPEAVRMACLMPIPNMKVIWFPTFTAKGAAKPEWMHDYRPLPLSINGKVLSEVDEILDIAGEHNLFISAGHSPFDELRPLAEAAAKKKVPVLLDHPLLELNKLNITEIKQLVSYGVYIGLYAQTFLPSIYNPICDPMETIEVINQIGAEHCLLGSDVGQILHLGGVEAMRLMIRGLLGLGITGKQISTMVRDVPKKLLKEH
jgi:hypothetical protein